MSLLEPQLPVLQKTKQKRNTTEITLRYLLLLLIVVKIFYRFY